MTAASAETVQFESMSLDRKTIARGDFFLKAFDVTIFEFHDLAAVGAD